MALGEVDYGLYGLVGGLTAFIAFFNNVLAGGNARFYAYSIGAAKVATDKRVALEECRWWFNTALSVHTLVPVVLIIVGYPVGAYAIEYWLTIPPDRIRACIWVLRFVSISCFVGMVSVPFHAMYRAKQYIAELTIYGFVTTTLNVIVLYVMVTHPSDWLVRFAAWGCLLSIVPQIIICIRACFIFPECRLNVRYMWNWSRLAKLGSYSGWQFLGVTCAMLRTNGLSIVINKFFGACMNAAFAVGTSMQAHCNTLASAMQGSFVPVITQACGAGDYVKVNRFVIRTNKFNVFLSLIFMIPLALELEYIVILWLKTPPAFACGLCYCAMILHLISCATTGHMVAVNATGNVAGYQVTLSSVNIFLIPIATIVGLIFRDVYFVMAVCILFEVLNSLGRVYFARRHVNASFRRWVRSVVLPSCFVIGICSLLGWGCRQLLPPTFLRVCLTTALCELMLLPMLWFVVLDQEEREFLTSRIESRLGKRFCK